MTFAELGLEQKLLDNLLSIGFINPTPIQEKVISYLKENKNTDIIALAQTGTGKTGAFGLPLIERIDFSISLPQAIILCPTRELCVQICNDLNTFSKPYPNAKIIPIYGGVSIDKQLDQLKRGVHIIVATPGRCLDLLERKRINTSNIKVAVLDEADEMLNMGFKPDIDKIFSKIEQERVVWLFSATMSREVRSIASQYMDSPIEITTGKNNTTAENLTHLYYQVQERHRYQALKRIVDFNPDIYGLIFCRTKNDTKKISEKLMEDGYNAAPLHGDLSQQQREMVMASFRSKNIQILVATDVAARGIDVSGITHVIHYQLPEDIESYTHRSGRTARAGRIGVSIALVNMNEQRRLRDIENLVKAKFVKESIPNGKEICMKQLHYLIDKVCNFEVKEEDIKPFATLIEEKLSKFTSQEIVQKFISVEFTRFLQYYKNSEDLNSASFERESRFKDRERSSSSDRAGSDRFNRRGDDRPRNGSSSSSSFSRGGYKRFFLGAGEKDRINKGAVLRAICDQTGLSAKSVGRIDILPEFSFVEVKDSDAREMEKVIKNKLEVGGNMINVEQAKPKN